MDTAELNYGQQPMFDFTIFEKQFKNFLLDIIEVQINKVELKILLQDLNFIHLEFLLSV